MNKVLFTYNYGDEAMAQVRALGFDAEFYYEKDIADYPHKDEVEILICYNPFQYVDLRAFKSLKLILLSSIGFDQLPKEIVKEMDITVCNNRGGYSIPMGEWIVMKVLEMFKHSKKLYANQEQHRWFMDTSITEVYHKRILFFGTGTIAKEAAKRLQGFEMEIIGLNTSGHESEYFDACYPLDESIEQVKQADAVVISLPLTELTTGLFDETHIAALKESAVLVNIARGEIIDEQALYKALKHKHFKAAALDVFHEEPLPEDHELYTLENVIITCHNSWISEMRNTRRFDIIYKNLTQVKNNGPLLNVIDIQRGY